MRYDTVMIKRTISAVLVIVLAIAAMTMSAVAVGAPTISVGAASGNPGDTVTVTLSIENNPGVCAMILTPTYDTAALRLDGAKLSDDFDGMLECVNKIVWIHSGGDSQNNGTFLTLSFTVLDSARAGDSKISLTYSNGDICNWDEKYVDFEIVSGKIEILSDGTGTVASTASPDSETNGDGSAATDKSAPATDKVAVTDSDTASDSDAVSKPAGKTDNTALIVLVVAVALAAVVLVCIVVRSKKKGKTGEDTAVSKPKENPDFVSDSAPKQESLPEENAESDADASNKDEKSDS